MIVLSHRDWGDLLHIIVATAGGSIVHCIHNKVDSFYSLHSPLDLTDTFPVSIACHCLLFQRRRWHPTPVLLPGKSHGLRSLVGCSPWDCEESDTTERLHFHFSLSCIGEGNGNPLQCSCLENPRDRGAWWAVVYGVAQSWTQLKRLTSSNEPTKSHGKW